MKKAIKIWLWIATGLCIAGLIVGIVGLLIMRFDFSSSNIPKYEDKTYEVSEDFNKISVDIRESDLEFVLSDDESCRVECKERARLGYSVKVVDGTLTVAVEDGRKWYDYIQIFSFGVKMTVYLPKAQYESVVINSTTGDVSVPKDFSFVSAKAELTTGDLKWQAAVSGGLTVKSTTGDMTVSGISPRSLDLKASTGRISVSDVSCSTASFKATTGGVRLKGVIAQESLKAELSTGDVKLDGCDSQSIFIKTSTGDVKGTLLSGKDFTAIASTGDIKVPRDSEGGQCYIETSTGDIEIKIG